jgi:hypothetical protein
MGQNYYSFALAFRGRPRGRIVRSRLRRRAKRSTQPHSPYGNRSLWARHGDGLLHCDRFHKTKIVLTLFQLVREVCSIID